MGQTHKAQSAMLLASLLAGCLTNGDRVLQPQEGGAVAATASRPNASEASGGATADKGRSQSSQVRASTGGSTDSNGVAGSASGGTGGSGAASPVSGSGGAPGDIKPTSEAEPVGGGGSVASATAGSSGTAGALAPVGAADPECDFRGVWIGQQLTVNQALDLPQTSNNWYFLEFAQNGEELSVADHMDCGIEIRGSATVTISRETLAAALRVNQQVGRKGTVKRVGNTCELNVEKFWSVRGAELSFVPRSGRAAAESIPEVAKAQPLPTQDNTAGAIDLEGDGQLGIAFQASGILSGTRNSVQRDWTRWFTEPGYEVAPSADWTEDLAIRADFDNEEVVIHTTSSLLSTLSTPVMTKHVLRLRFLGRSREDDRAQAVIKTDDVDTCYAVQDALPATALEAR